MIQLTSLDDCQQQRQQWQGKTIGFVPTMGNLHDGHLSLVQAAQSQCDKVIISIFVNPTQFAPHEDFDSYPRTLQEDLAKLTNVDAVFLPTEDWFYPLGKNCLRVSHHHLKDKLCGQSRPHFFDGVCTVVLKLFNAIQPTHAFFGDKDRQQRIIIQQMVKDLLLPIEVIGCPIVREADGLAMSSRNQYLDPTQRKTASILYQTLTTLKSAAQNTTDFEQLVIDGKQHLTNAGFEVDYLQFCNPTTLNSAKTLPAILFAAASLGQTRLIDNVNCGPL